MTFQAPPKEVLCFSVAKGDAVPLTASIGSSFSASHTETPCSAGSLSLGGSIAGERSVSILYCGPTEKTA